MSKMWLSCIYLKILAALGQGISGKLALNLSGLCFIILLKNRNWSCLMWNGRDRWKWKQDKPDQCFSNSCFSKHRFLGPNLRYCLLEFFKTPFLTRRRQWHPTAVLLPGKSHGQRSLVGCSPWVAKNWTWLSDFTFTFHFHALEKEMATHSSVLAWRIPGTGEPGGLLFMGSHRVRHDWRDLTAAAAAILWMSLTMGLVKEQNKPAPCFRK